METACIVHPYKKILVVFVNLQACIIIKYLKFLFVVGMMHSFIGFLFDLITCQVKLNKKEEKVSIISYKYMYVVKNNNIFCFQQ